MYADRHVLSQGPRPVSLGASFLITGGIMAALVFVAPEMITLAPPEPIETYNVPIPPEPIEVKPEPKTEAETVRETKIVAPQPPVPPIPDATNPIETTDAIPAYRPPAEPGTPAGAGDVAIKEIPQPPLALLGASFDPRYAKDLQPDYPGQELRNSREGIVTVRIRIGVDGRVKEVEKLAATSDAFFEATRRQALSRWRFKPATRGGIPEESWKRMSVRFEVKS